ncbi:PLP-dependent aminotransferase family protein [Cohnella sp. REN36]|uniref:MocR-like pyridoxine biosynthesis transcription factor PdxR n=1 Tax=Cohnella sp. REN36 TaxID=2887347 RepID=UPI001D13D2A3|nr:PLP-dependent aminotransferase family protein [Cohnella sp. REN36]MCC3375400.1 PLP-dependent aminotransferase family protein [Cohnella sp. REN36]
MWFAIDRRETVPLFRQVLEAFREAILTGRMPAGAKLPSTRELAGELGISRNVALEAYEQLLAEGYIVGRPGAGTYVADGACMKEYESGKAPSAPENRKADAVTRKVGAAISFKTGQPAADRFPLRLWGTLLQRAAANIAPDDLGYGDPAGWAALRRELADHLWRTRGVVCRPEQVLVTNGAVQALNLLTRLLLRAGDEIILEDPTNEDLKTLFASTGATIISVRADDEGLDPRLLPQQIRPKCVYVTPSHHFPLGGVLPIQRRIALLSYLRRGDGYLIEDDYDSEFRYDGPPIHSLQSLDPERVVYVGTFSKTMFPALRIGFMVLPEPLVAGARALKRLSDFQTPILDQLALARFLEEGHLRAHLQKMKKLYHKKRNRLVQAMEVHWTKEYRILGQAVGLHLAVSFAADFPPDAVRRMAEAGVEAGILPKRKMLLGYGHLSETEIEEGVRRLGRALDLRKRESGKSEFEAALTPEKKAERTSVEG